LRADSDLSRMWSLVLIETEAAAEPGISLLNPLHEPSDVSKIY